MFGYGAIAAGKSAKKAGEARRADSLAKAEDAFRRGDVMEYLVQSIRADPSSTAAIDYARATGLLPALDPSPNPRILGNSPQPPPRPPHTTTSNPFNQSEGRPPSVWDAPVPEDSGL